MKYYSIFSSLLLTVGLFTACDNSAKQSNNTQQAHTNTQSQHTHQAAPMQSASPSLEELAMLPPAETLPAFKFYHVRSGISFTNDDIVKGKNNIFILFDPSCGHCQQETTELSKNHDKIQDLNIYFVSMNDPALMVSFLDTFGPNLKDKENVKMLYDKDQVFIRKIHIPNQFPANYIYDANGQLKTYWEGVKNIEETLTAYLN